MLKLSVRPGEYVLIGDDIKLVFAGGSSNNLRILIDAPRAYNIVRSEALERYGMAADPGNEVKHYRDRELSPEAKEKIKAILMAERRKARRKERATELHR
ncbi:carbon storage regulator [Lachnospiraceae bacterium KK002]